MKKAICLLFALTLLCTVFFTGCKNAAQEESEETAAAPTETEAAKEWTREGYFTDEDGNFLSVTYMDDVEEPGWYVGAMLGEDMYGNLVQQEGGTLHGNIVPDYEEGEFLVTVSEEGEDGLLLTVDGGDLSLYKIRHAGGDDFRHHQHRGYRHGHDRIR